MALANRGAAITSDTFDTAINNPPWTNPTQGFNTLVWATGGLVRPGGSGDRAMCVNTGTYSNDQYCTLVFGNLGNANGNWAGAGVQDQNAGVSSNGFVGFVETAGTNSFVLMVTPGFTLIAEDTSFSAPMSSGHTLTCEHRVAGVESALEIWMDQGSGEGALPRLSATTTGTLGQTGGRPYIFLRHNAPGNSEITSMTGGDIVAAPAVSLSLLANQQSQAGF